MESKNKKRYSKKVVALATEQVANTAPSLSETALAPKCSKCVELETELKRKENVIKKLKVDIANLNNELKEWKASVNLLAAEANAAKTPVGELRTDYVRPFWKRWFNIK